MLLLLYIKAVSVIFARKKNGVVPTPFQSLLIFSNSNNNLAEIFPF